MKPLTRITFDPEVMGGDPAFVECVLQLALSWDL